MDFVKGGKDKDTVHGRVNELRVTRHEGGGEDIIKIMTHVAKNAIEHENRFPVQDHGREKISTQQKKKSREVNEMMLQT